MNRQTIKQAFYKSVPVMAGYLVLGIGFGILLRTAGYGVLWSAAMGLFIWIREKKNAVWIDSFSIAGSMLIAMTAAIFLGKLG